MSVHMILFLILLSTNCFGQILNSDFTEWENLQNYEKPLNWITDQHVYGQKILRGYENENSWVKFSIDYNTGDCSASISQTIPTINNFDQINELEFELKTQSLNPDSTTFFKIQMFYFLNNTQIINEEIILDTLLLDFSKVYIPLSNHNSDSLFIKFTGGGFLTSYSVPQICTS